MQCYVMVWLALICNDMLCDDICHGTLWYAKVRYDVPCHVLVGVGMLANFSSCVS